LFGGHRSGAMKSGSCVAAAEWSQEYDGPEDERVACEASAERAGHCSDTAHIHCRRDPRNEKSDTHFDMAVPTPQAT